MHLLVGSKSNRSAEEGAQIGGSKLSEGFKRLIEMKLRP